MQRECHACYRPIAPFIGHVQGDLERFCGPCFVYEYGEDAFKRAQIVAGLEAAYVYMLQTPHGLQRIRQQDAFCSVRDGLSIALGWSAQETQEYYEEIASKKA